MSEEFDINDAISILWVNAPDAMEMLIDNLVIEREVKFRAIRAAKQKGLSADWIEGEMLAYDEMRESLMRPDINTAKPL